MVGRIIWSDEARRLTLERETVCTLPLAAVALNPGGRPKAAEKRVDKAARLLAEQGVRRVLTPEGFPWWSRLAAWGLEPIDPVPFLQAQAGRLALAALVQLGISPGEATVALRTGRVTQPFYNAAMELCTRVRYLVVEAQADGGALAAYLRREYGVAVLPQGAPAQVALHFSPRQSGTAERVICLYGPEARLAGLTLDAPNLPIPTNCDRLRLLALLWEVGRLPNRALVVFGGETT